MQIRLAVVLYSIKVLLRKDLLYILVSVFVCCYLQIGNEWYSSSFMLVYVSKVDYISAAISAARFCRFSYNFKP